MPPIINCHVHLFTRHHLPDRILPPGLATLAKWGPFRRGLSRTLHFVNPLDRRDYFSRIARFVETVSYDTQAEAFKEVQAYYPDDTRFVVLPMNLNHIGAGKSPKNIAEQHQELAKLALEKAPYVLPFIAVDPREHGGDGDKIVQDVEELLGHKHNDGSAVFRGIKLYPPLGYAPEDERLIPIWELCNERGLPILAHCSRGGVRHKTMAKAKTIQFTDPDQYRALLKTYPNVPVCLAHFGGSTDWNLYFKDGASRKEVPLDSPSEDRKHMNWLTKIMQMIESGEYPNLYTDISYTVFAIEDNLPAMTVILRGSKAIRSHTLFGSDYYMSHQEKFDERYLSMQLRATLGEDVFDDIARNNPTKYLKQK